MISIIPKPCPEFVADIAQRAANDHDRVQFKLLPRVSAPDHRPSAASVSDARPTVSRAAGNHTQRPSIPANENPLATVREAEQMLRCCKTTVNTLINAGKLERIKIGRATRITVRSIRAITGAV